MKTYSPELRSIGTLLKSLRPPLRAFIVGVWIVACPMISTPCLASTSLDDAEVAIRTRDFSRAVRILEPLAAAGDAEAQYLLAGLYRVGNGVPKDLTLALRWAERAAHQGHVRAMYLVGNMNARGLGTKEDLAVARAWLEKAEAAGHSGAKRKLRELAASTTTNPANREHSLVSSSTGVTPGAELQAAARSGSTSRVRKALGSVSNVDVTDDLGRTALMDAAERGHSDVVVQLINAGASPGKRDRYGDNALLLAAQNSRLATVRTLLQARVNPNVRDQRNNSAMHIAALRGDADVIATLLSAGADPNVKNKEGMTPRDLAERNSHPAVASLLVVAL